MVSFFHAADPSETPSPRYSGALVFRSHRNARNAALKMETRVTHQRLSRFLQLPPDLELVGMSPSSLSFLI